MKRVILTGSTGFIGSNLLPLLQQSGYEVCALSNQTGYKGTDIWNMQVNLLDRFSMANVLKEVRPDYLIHLAWDVGPGYQTSLNNLEWMHTTLDLMRMFVKYGGSKAVFAGTCFEYPLDSGYCIEENLIPKSHDFYGSCKKATGDAMRALSDMTGVPIVWGRVFYLYGPNERRTRVVPSVIVSLLRNGTAKCSHGKQLRDFLHVHDVANGFLHLLKSGVSGVVNIASGEGCEIKGIAGLIAAKLGQSVDSIKFGALPAPPNDPQFVVGYNSKLLSTGWKQEYSLDGGLIETIDWWKQRLTNGE